jgi:hypothetical protein
MSNADDMDRPITKREAFELFITKGELHDVMKNLFDYLDKRFESIDKRFEVILETNAGEHAATRAAIRLENAAEHAAIRRENAAEHATTRAFMSSEIARHTAANAEQSRSELVVVDDKYKDLPERVTKLEDAVFPAPPAKRQRRR